MRKWKCDTGSPIRGTCSILLSCFPTSCFTKYGTFSDVRKVYTMGKRPFTFEISFPSVKKACQSGKWCWLFLFALCLLSNTCHVHLPLQAMHNYQLADKRYLKVSFAKSQSLWEPVSHLFLTAASSLAFRFLFFSFFLFWTPPVSRIAALVLSSLSFSGLFACSFLFFSSTMFTPSCHPPSVAQVLESLW